MLSVSRPAKATVLVVEDDRISRELAAQLLLMGRFDVIAAPTGERALLTLCRHGNEIDWLVSKLSLPGLICGWILTDEYHAHHPDRPALLIAEATRTARVSSAPAVFIPPSAPMKALEVLQMLRDREPEPALPIRTSQAA
jgi:CheY-like chemotaxis protein